MDAHREPSTADQRRGIYGVLMAAGLAAAVPRKSYASQRALMELLGVARASGYSRVDCISNAKWAEVLGIALQTGSVGVEHLTSPGAVAGANTRYAR